MFFFFCFKVEDVTNVTLYDNTMNIPFTEAWETLN